MSYNKQDISGSKYGMLTVLKEADGYSKWLCRCDCGNETTVGTYDLVHGKTKSCGCLRKKLLSNRTKMDLAGMRFGRLTVEEECGRPSYDRRPIWRCRCDCGNIINVKSKNLLSGDTRSCGCVKHEMLVQKNTKHGMSHERLYTIWRGMRSRCNTPTNSSYTDYGGRGICVCDEWKDYAVFRKWALSHGYSDDLSIDRIDVNGDYEPSNCRFVSLPQQARNTRRNRMLTCNGETKTMAEWSEIYGVPEKYIKSRIDKYGWSVCDAIMTPVMRYGERYQH